MDSSTVNVENIGNTTPVKGANNKRLNVASPFSAASPQHRRPLKARNLEGDANLEASMMDATLDMSTVDNQSAVKHDDTPLEESKEDELDCTLSEEVQQEIQSEETQTSNVASGTSLADELDSLRDSDSQAEEVSAPKAHEADVNLEATMLTDGPSLAQELGLDASITQSDENISAHIEKDEGHITTTQSSSESVSGKDRSASSLNLSDILGTSLSYSVNTSTASPHDTSLASVLDGILNHVSSAPPSESATVSPLETSSVETTASDTPLEESKEDELDRTLSEEIQQEIESEETQTSTVVSGTSLADELDSLKVSDSQADEKIFAHEGDVNLEATMLTDGPPLAQELGLMDSSDKNSSSLNDTAPMATTASDAPSLSDELCGLMDASNVQSEKSCTTHYDTAPTTAADALSLADELGVQSDSSVVLENGGRVTTTQTSSESVNGNDIPASVLNLSDIVGSSNSINTSTITPNDMSLSSELGGNLNDMSPVPPSESAIVSPMDTSAVETTASEHDDTPLEDNKDDELDRTLSEEIQQEIQSEETQTSSAVSGTSLADELDSLRDSDSQAEEKVPAPKGHEGDVNLEATMLTDGPSLAQEMDTSIAQSEENISTHDDKIPTDIQSLAEELKEQSDMSVVSEKDEGRVTTTPPSTHSLSDIVDSSISYSVNTSTVSPNGTSLASESFLSHVSPTPRSDSANNSVVTVSMDTSAVETAASEQSFATYLDAQRPPADVSTPKGEDMATDESAFTPEEEDDSARTPTRERSVSSAERFSPIFPDERQDVARPLPIFNNAPTSPEPLHNCRPNESLIDFLNEENKVYMEFDKAQAAELLLVKQEVSVLKQTIAILEDKLEKETSSRELAERDSNDFQFLYEDQMSRMKKKESEYRRQIFDLEARVEEQETGGDRLKSLQEEVNQAEERARSAEEKQRRLEEDLRQLQMATEVHNSEKTQFEAEVTALKNALESAPTLDELTSTENSLQETEKRLQEQTARVAELEQAKEAAPTLDDVQKLQNEKEELAARVAELENGIKDLTLVTDEAKTLREKLETLSSQDLVAQERARAAEGRSVMLAEQVKELEASLEKQYVDEEAMAQQLKSLREKLDASTSKDDLVIEKERAKAAEDHVEQLTTQIQQLQDALQKNEKDRDVAKEEAAELRLELENSNQRDEAMKEEVRAAAKEKEELAATISQLEKNSAILQEKLDNAIKEVPALLQDHEEMQRRQDAADAALLQEKTTVEELRSKLTTAAENLSASETKLVQAERAADDLRKQIDALASDSEESEALKVKYAQLEMRLELSEGQVASIPAIREQLKTSKIRNAELEAKIELCRKSVTELNTTKEQLAEATEKIDVLEAKMRVIGSEGNAEEEKRKELSDRIASLTATNARLDTEKGEINERLSQKDAELKELAAKSDDAIARIQAEKEAAFCAKVTEVEDLRQKLNTANSQSAESADIIKALTATNKDMEKELEERRRSAINVLPAKKSGEEEKLRAQVEELRMALAKQKDDSDKMADEMDSLEADYKQRIRNLNDANEELKARLGDNNTPGLLNALRPAGIAELPAGSPVSLEKTAVFTTDSPAPPMATLSPAASMTLDTRPGSATKAAYDKDKTCKQQ